MRNSVAVESLAFELLEQSCCTKASSPSQYAVKPLHVTMFRLAGEAAPPPPTPPSVPQMPQFAVTSSFDQLRRNGQPKWYIGMVCNSATTTVTCDMQHVTMFRLAGEAAPPQTPLRATGATQFAVTSSFDQLRQNGQL